MPRQAEKLKDMIVLVRGGGEMATGVAHRLARSGFRVCLTEIPEPLAVRREVSFCEAVFEGQKEVEGLMAKKAADKEEIMNLWAEDKIPVVVDPQGVIRKELHPQVLVNAILAKRNLNTKRNHAPLVIGLGPGFRVGRDCHLVVETNRGHRLGRVIEEGEAEANTGLPGEISGYTWERVLRAPATGKFQGKKEIGDRVEKGEVVAEVEGFSVAAKVSGVLRGILRSGLWVQEKMKVGDIDPRGVREHCFTISEKARAIGGGVLEAILMRYNRSRVSN